MSESKLQQALERMPGWFLIGRRDGSYAVVHASSVAAVDQVVVGQLRGDEVRHVMLYLHGGASIDLHAVVTLEAAVESIADALEREGQASTSTVVAPGLELDVTVVGEDRIPPRVQHGINCDVAPHTSTLGYEHAEGDHAPYFYRGKLCCGRCHEQLPLQPLKPEPFVASGVGDAVAGRRRQHGLTCVKVPHDKRSGGYMHASDDDGLYDVDGVTYCGRCHEVVTS